MTKKEGDLRIRKSGTMYGPMTRDALDRLLATGKVALGDQVSVRGGAWTDLGDYLASASRTAAAPAPLPTPAAAPPADNDPVLRLLTNKRIVTALSRSEVTQLHLSGRIDDEDLICALYGPWMRVGDFLAPPRSKPSATLLEEQSDASTLADPAPAAPQAVPPPIAPFAIPGPAVVSGASPPAIGEGLTDEWFVRVRGIYSAPLGKRHVRALFDAKEITPDNAARHATWPDDAWLPIRAIAQLADAVK